MRKKTIQKKKRIPPMFTSNMVRSSIVLVEFEDKFHSQHKPTRKYDISFSFNRVCLKRAYQAVNDLSDSSLKTVFPNYYPAQKIIPSIQYYLDPDMSLAVRHILSIQGSMTYLISGPRCVCQQKTSSH